MKLYVRRKDLCAKKLIAIISVPALLVGFLLINSTGVFALDEMDSAIGWVARFDEEALQNQWFDGGNSNPAGYTTPLMSALTNYYTFHGKGDVVENEFGGTSIAYSFTSNSHGWYSVVCKLEVDIDKYPYLYIGASATTENTAPITLNIDRTGDPKGNEALGRHSHATGADHKINMRDYIEGSGVQSINLTFGMVLENGGPVWLNLDYLFVGNEAADPIKPVDENPIEWVAHFHDEALQNLVMDVTAVEDEANITFINQ